MRADPDANARRFAYAYRGLLAAAHGTGPSTLGAPSLSAPSEAQDAENRRLLATLRAKSMFAEHLQNGAPLEDAVVAMTRELLAAKNHVDARSICQSLLDAESTRVAGALGSALVALRMELVELAYAAFQIVPAPTWQRLAPVEYVRAALLNGDPSVVDETRAMVAEARDLPPAVWLSLTQVAFGHGDTALARELAEHCDDLIATDPEGWREVAQEWARFRPWVERREGVTDHQADPEALAWGILDYRQPDWRNSSSNLGDYVQSIAALGHLLRHRRLEFTGPDDLVSMSQGLHRRVRNELVLDTPARRVRLYAVNRDASSLDVLADPTWLIAFGWYMHDMFGLRTDFPFHPNIRPIFISFHCNRRKMLTPEAIAYLRRYGPVGCRDWNTVDLLLSIGVPAFFSGCLTTTVNTVFPDQEAGHTPSNDIAYVDVKAPKGATAISQAKESVRDASLAANVEDALALLERYRSDFHTVVTSRLHCYLPAWAIGARVDFRPKNRADVRFSGLMDADESGLRAMQQRILGLLEPITTALVTGASEEEVYAIWREVCAPEVELARRRHTEVGPLPPPSFDIAEQCSRVRDASVVVPAQAAPAGDPVHVALALDANLKRELEVVVTAMVHNTERPLHLWILSREHGAVDHDRMASLFPEVTITWLPCDEIDYGPVLGMLKHITVSTMDRLLLPDLLPDVDRIVYHDIDALPLGDVGVLFDLDLAGAPLAARSAVARHVTSGYDTIHLSAKRLRHDPDAANDLLHRMYAVQPFDFAAFNAGILVLDLARMRLDNFARDYLPFVERYGMNDQEVLNCYAGSRRHELAPAWNALPTQEVVAEPLIIHWAGPLKPWLPRYVALRDRWQEYEEMVQRRRTGQVDGAHVSG